MPGKGERRNFRKRGRLFRLDVPRAGNRRPSRRGGIARHNVIVSNGSALNVALRSPRSVGENFASRVAVFRGIGINQQGRGAFALRGRSEERRVGKECRSRWSPYH